MKKLLLLAILLGALSSQAATVSQSRAMELARQFLTHGGPNRAPSAMSASRLSLAHTATTATGEAHYYVFNITDAAGYVIIAGDDITTPVLGYSDNGSFDANNMPDGLKYWLGEYQRQLEYLKLHPDRVRQAPSTGTAVKPLLTCNWNQSAPYNNNCPTYSSTSGTKRSATGCVATATAQIMYYHKWPAQGTGSHSYSCNVNGASRATTLSANFANSLYDWANMIDNYDSNSTPTQNAAVAKLMSDVGISVDMDYGASSGAYSPDVVTALTTYFKYDKSAQYLARDNYGIEAWETTILNELKQGRPVYYSGQSSEGGHAFVCDGADSNGYFHINWGWGGMSNGYFMLSMLNPDDQGIGSFEGGYNSSQGIIINIKPDEGGQPVATPLSGSIKLTTSTTSCNLGSNATFTMNSVCMSGTKNWNTLYWGLVITDAQLNPTQNYKQSWVVDASSVEPGNSYSVSSITFAPPTSLAEGKYYLRAAYLINQSQTYLFTGATASNYIIDMEVKGGKAYFTEHHEPSNLTATGFELSSNPIYKDQTYTVKVEVKNNSDMEYFGNLYFALMRNGTAAYTSSAFLTGIYPHGSRTLDARLKASVTAGTYDLAVLNEAKEVIGQIPVTVADGGGTINLSIVTNVTPEASQMPAKDVRATAVVKNTGGTFSGPIEMFLLRSDNSIIDIISSDVVTIAKNQSATVSFKTEFAGNVGTTYYLCLRNPNPQYASSYSAWGSLVPFTVCAEPEEPQFDPCDVNKDGEIDIADVNTIVACILGESTFRNRADINGDGNIGVDDISIIIDMIMN